MNKEGFKSYLRWANIALIYCIMAIISLYVLTILLFIYNYNDMTMPFEICLNSMIFSTVCVIIAIIILFILYSVIESSIDHINKYLER